MLPYDSVLQLVASVACHLIFNRFEPKSLRSLTLLLVIFPGAVAIFSAGKTLPLGSLLISYSLYYFDLLLLIISYRLSPFHSLSKYPGPITCKLSKLWLAYIASQGKLHVYIKHLHDKYGPIVRVGPNELSIIDTSHLPFILGAKGMPRGPMWDGRSVSGYKAPEERGLVNRDLKLHAEARKAWNTPFTPAAIKGYEPLLIRRVTQLMEALRAEKNDAIDISRWFSFFSFDFMGDMVFGGGFELMSEGDKHGLWDIMERGLFLPSITQQIPWCIDLIRWFPMVVTETRKYAKFGTEQVWRRLQEGSVHNDLLYHLMEHKRGSSEEPYPFGLLVTNAIFAIGGGSDTTATTLSNTVFCLLSHPTAYKRLQEEIDETFPRGQGTKEPDDAALLSKMPYLNAVIKESLRLQPPIPTMLQRAPAVGSGSHTLGNGIVIPEGTAVIVPPYAMQRDPGNFYPDPDGFRPERWFPESHCNSEFKSNLDAFIPFSTGPANCVGRNVGLLKARMVLAYMMRTFEMSFAEGYEKKRWDEDLHDHFMVKRGNLPVSLVARFSD
ncbi:cytochrome P450 [Mycena polygramma]|nr:cytochrome P450 [Mycena polygramma]